jgi:hypothetical protein
MSQGLMAHFRSYASLMMIRASDPPMKLRRLGPIFISNMSLIDVNDYNRYISLVNRFPTELIIGRFG